jgi:uncharacterized protein (UPF0335 family)
MSDARLKSFIDRVLRLKTEQDELGKDIRDVYAEAKGEGYDKTVMGKLVAHLRKVLKEGDGAVSEQENVFDTYLLAYHRASGMRVGEEDEMSPRTHAHARTTQPPRAASLTEKIEAYRAGNPISQDFRFENGCVYFIAFRDVGRVKIGVSSDVASRIADIEKNVGEECEIIAIVPGNRQAEMHAHDHHKAWRVSGEWYRLCDDLLASIASYTATHTHEVDYDRSTGEIIDRDARRRARTSEAMDDNIAFSADMVADGLISEEAHAENVALSNAVARKYGNGPMNTHSGAISTPDAPVTSSRDSSATEGAEVEPRPLANQPETAIEMDRATEGSFETGSEAAEKERKAIPDRPEGVTLNHAGTGESPVAINERCQTPTGCKFSHHPYKITCSGCSAAWSAKAKAKRERENA